MVELKPIGTLFTEGEFKVGLQDLWSLWRKIPDPKTATLNAYLVIEYGVEFALKAGDLDEAQRWAELAPSFQQVRQDMGEVELLIGRVALERGESEVARENFSIANAKSEGWAFEGRHKKYKAFVR